MLSTQYLAETPSQVLLSDSAAPVESLMSATQSFVHFAVKSELQVNEVIKFIDLKMLPNEIIVSDFSLLANAKRSPRAPVRNSLPPLCQRFNDTEPGFYSLSIGEPDIK
jgi:hypothetical protein